ncbi:MAG: hypothetical protein CVU05_12955 [Bacteroidetes bacterium HGW-Bacteroidetes-21]|jgi:hypothetical protein|nr:MAG: hypothetical protein CVU05_12955 [Bacteroidetes bacterium HGW-Bacteroidetes-21]
MSDSDRLENRIKKEHYLREQLDDVMTPKQIDFVVPYFLDFPFRLKIIPKRKTYAGLCRMPRNKYEEFVISVAYNPVKAVFFIVFLHEIAHMIVHIEKGRKISSSHGIEWSNAFRELLLQSLEKNCFYENEMFILQQFFRSGKKVTNKSMSSVEMIITDLYATNVIRLKDIPDQAVFTLKNGMTMKKVKKMRTRYHCIEAFTGKQYRVHLSAEVISWKSE